jgi:hypothetical protein
VLHALLTFALAASQAAPALPGGHLEAIERLPLVDVAGPITVRGEPLEARIVVEAPRDPARLAKRLKTMSRLLCPMVEAGPRTVILHCRSTRIEAALVLPGGRPALELRELVGLPGTGEVAMPILFPRAASACCGTGSAARPPTPSGSRSSRAAAAPSTPACASATWRSRPATSPARSPPGPR